MCEGDDDLAVRVPGLTQTLGDLGQRVAAVQDRCGHAVLDQRGDGGQIRTVFSGGQHVQVLATNTLTAATRPARRRDLRQIVEAGDRRQGRQRRGPGYLALAAVGCNAPGRQLQVQLGLSKLTVITPLALRAKCVTSWPTTLEPSGANTRIVRVNVVLEFLSLRLKFPHAVACPV